MNMPGPSDAEECRSGGGGELGLNLAGTLFFTLFTHFLPKKSVKEQLLHSVNARNNLLRFSVRILLQICLYSTLLGRYG